MQETDELNATPPLSTSYEGRPAVYTGLVLCQICYTSCLKKNVKREKLEKIHNIEHFKERALRWKNCTSGFMHLLIGKRGEMAHKNCRRTFFKESFLILK